MTDFAGSVDAALFSKLTTTPGTAFYGTRIYNMQAPEGVPRPYIIFSQIAGGNDNLTPNDSNDLTYRVECVGATRSDAATGNGYIQQALGSIQYELTVTNYSNYALQRQESFSRVDNIGGTQYWRRGDNYRIRFDHT